MLVPRSPLVSVDVCWELLFGRPASRLRCPPHPVVASMQAREWGSSGERCHVDPQSDARLAVGLRWSDRLLPWR